MPLIIAATAKSLGQDIEELALNRSTIRRERMKRRQEEIQKIFDNFDPDKGFIVVHWDGKLINDNWKGNSAPLTYSGII